MKPDIYWLTTDAMLLAADLWAQARAEIIIATTNVGHLSRFLSADLWDNIRV